MSTDERGDDAPDIFPGEVVHTDNGDLAYKVIKQIGTGRCCVVYSGSAVRDGSLVALKFFRRGQTMKELYKGSGIYLTRYKTQDTMWSHAMPT